jgi:hypothetical protein
MVRGRPQASKFENTGGEYQDTILNPTSVGFFIYYHFRLVYIYLIWQQLTV